MKLSWRYLVLLLILAAFLGIGIFDFSLISTFLIEPIARILWLIIRLFLVIDQQIYWTLLIFVVFYFILCIIPNRRENYGSPATYLNRSRQDDRLEYWESMIENTAVDLDAGETLQSGLEDLACSVDELAGQNGRKKEISLPLREVTLGQRIQTKVRKSFIIRFLPGLQSHRYSDLEESVARILDSLETTLEIQNDRSTNRNNDD